MRNLKHNLEEVAIPMPITQMAEQTARQFAQQQQSQQKSDQVYLNTLAVHAVDNYLRIMGIPTQLAAGDSWNPLVRGMANVADLCLPELGRLECRPLLETNASCVVPEEVLCDRIGYIVVQINTEEQEATILGFTKTATAELSLSTLKPIDDLFPYLFHLRQTEATPTLSQWLVGVLSEGWSTLETLLEGPQLELAFRNQEQGVLRAKQLHIEGTSLILGVSISPQSDDKMLIVATVQPSESQAYLPAHLSLQLLDSEEAIAMEAEGRTENHHLAFEFSGVEGDRFSLKMTLNGTSVSENFVI